MTLRYLLDTDIVSDLQGTRAAGNQIRSRMEKVGPHLVGTSVVTAEEQLKGRFAQVQGNAVGDGSKLCEAYKHLREAIEFFRGLALADYTSDAHGCFVNLRTEGKITSQKVKTHDLRIGCIALVNSLIVVTRNRQDFERIPGLQVEDWSRPL